MAKASKSLCNVRRAGPDLSLFDNKTSVMFFIKGTRYKALFEKIAVEEEKT